MLHENHKVVALRRAQCRGNVCNSRIYRGTVTGTGRNPVQYNKATMTHTIEPNIFGHPRVQSEILSFQVSCLV